MRIYDGTGSSIKLTQWDNNRKIYFDKPSEVNVIAHIFNSYTKAAKVVPTTTSDNKLVCVVPNILLQESKPIVVMLYAKNAEEGKVVGSAEIEVEPKAKPEDYEFVENVEYTDWIDLTKEARQTLDALHKEYDALNQSVEDLKTAANGVIADTNAAKDNANNMAEEASKVNILMKQTVTGATIETTDRHGIVTTANIDTIISVKDWKNVQMLVREGAGPDLFPTGYTFGVKDAVTGAIEDNIVIAHDHIKVTNPKLTRTMTLRRKLTRNYDNGGVRYLQFCKQQALYHAAEGLEPGTYNFTVHDQPWCAEDEGKTYQFTLVSPVPAGGQLVLYDNSYNKPLLGTHIASYGTIAGTSHIELAELTEGASGTSLGQTDGSSKNMNHIHRVLLGSNNYAQSALEQLINSAGKGNEAWKPATRFDRAPTWLGLDGLLNHFEKDFLDVVQTSIIPCRTNSVFETESLDGTQFAINSTYNLERKFFLLSLPEMYGIWDSTSVKDGTVMEYFDGMTNEQRKIYDGTGAAVYAWLRSPSPGYASYERYVRPSGDYYNNYANNTYAVAEAYTIA